MWNFIWPIALVVLSNTFYNITAKSTPSGANAFLSLTVTYIVAGVCSLGLYLLNGGQKLTTELSKLNWTAPALGVVIIGLEIGWIYVYRAGWKINTGSLVANICLACVLIAVGFLFYHENLSLRQIAGICVCIGGLILVTG